VGSVVRGNPCKKPVLAVCAISWYFVPGVSQLKGQLEKAQEEGVDRVGEGSPGKRLSPDLPKGRVSAFCSDKKL